VCFRVVGKGAQGRGTIIFEHEATPCTDGRYHRHCKGRWRGVLSRGFGPDGRRRRYKVSGQTKQDVIDALNKKREELDAAGLATSRSYKVERAARDWLEHGLPGRSERTRQIYRDALAPLLGKIAHKTLRDLTAEEVEAGLNSLTVELSSRSLQIAHNSICRAIRYAEAKGKIGRNVAALIDRPKGRAGRRRRAFSLPQAAALILASRELPVLELHAGLKDSRRPASLMHANITVSLMAGVRPEEARAISWDEDVALDGDPPYVAVLRADRAGGDTKAPKSRRALKLPQMAVGALRDWKADQPGRSPPSSRPSRPPAWCCPARSPSGAPAAATPAALAAPTRPACTAPTGSGPARSPPGPSAAGSAPGSSTTTRPGSTTTGGCATCSPGSKHSAPPPSKPTRAGSTSPEPPAPAADRPSHNTVAAGRLTRGHAADQRLFPQVTAKCEDLSR
jgi:hypothetical protein